jgi:hypothetical protein
MTNSQTLVHLKLSDRNSFSVTNFSIKIFFQFCIRQGKQLVEITNADEQRQLSTFISQIDTRNVNNYWAGITYNTSEGHFQLATNSQVIAYTNWGPGEPNQNGDEDCVQIQQVSHTWNDNDCKKHFYAICQTIQ